MKPTDLQVAHTEGLRGRTVQAEIDLSAIAANTRAVREMVGPGCRVMAVVKANGYGLGARWIGGAALDGGAAMLGVACVDEGVELRRAGYDGPILVMSYMDAEEAMLAVKNALTITLHRPRIAHALQAVALELGMAPGSVAVHIKVDTGLGRFGCLPEEFMPLARVVAECDRLRLEGLMTHFADADAPDQSFAREQLRRFNLIRKEADEAGISFEIVHAANSAAAMYLPEARFDMVRVGIMLSGNTPTPDREAPLALQHALTLRTKLARIYPVATGDTVGYGRTWTAGAKGMVGLIPVGYGDGYNRLFSNRAEVLVRGRRCPIVGRVSMDQCTVDLSGVSGAAEGDEVVLIGKQGSEEITPDELARLCGTISYEIMCGLSKRVPRHYIREGKPVEVCNLLGCSSLGDE